MDRGPSLILTLAIGALIAFQPPANALLARQVGDLGAAFTSLVISTVIVGALLVAANDVGHLSGLRHMRPEYLLGGIGGAAIVYGTIVTVRSLGAAGVVAALLAAQVIASLIIDRFGLLGVTVHALTPARVLGGALLVVGVVLVIR